MIKVQLPAPMLAAADLTGDVLHVHASTLSEIFTALGDAQEGLKACFFDSTGAPLDCAWAIFINGALADINTAVSDGDEVEIRLGKSDEVDTAEAFTPAEVRRYARHFALPQVGRAGQTRLKQARVLIVGAGGLGSPVALYLAAAGVGHIRIVDSDSVEESNLQRQVLHDVSWLDKAKVESARARMAKINPHIEIEAVCAAIDDTNAKGLVAGCDVVVDCTDNFATRLLLNRETRHAGVPLVFGAVFQFSGHVAVFNDRNDAPCYQCVFPHVPSGDLAPNCAEGGVMGVVPGIVGMMQANEALKLILGIGRVLSGRLVVYDALESSSREFRFLRESGCPGCSGLEQSSAPVSVETFGETALRPDQIITPDEAAKMINLPSPPMLIDVRELGELEICCLDGAINLPLGTLDRTLSGLDPEGDYIVVCRSGMRSQRAVQILEAAGFTRVRHIDGGLLRWSRDVDPGMTIV